MIHPQPVFLILLLALPLSSFADPETEVRDAIAHLTATSHAWETTVRQRFSGETADPRINLNAPVEVRGRVDPAGYTEITLQPSRELPVPVTAVFREGDVVGHTPLGWLRRTEIRQASREDRAVTFEGRPIRLARLGEVALQVTARKTLTEELFDLLPDVKSYRAAGGVVIAELHDRAVERLWGSAQAKRAPEIQGTIIFRLADAGLTEFHVVLAIGFPNSRSGKTTWSMVQWSTRISGIGSTTVEPPEAAIKALAE